MGVYRPAVELQGDPEALQEAPAESRVEVRTVRWGEIKHAVSIFLPQNILLCSPARFARRC